MHCMCLGLCNFGLSENVQ
uniref:Uncharacterized protein n=1 Tax=Anguilla anguilla TaxID=7936 RepID=A0A0E9T400_ANGAN